MCVRIYIILETHICLKDKSHPQLMLLVESMWPFLTITNRAMVKASQFVCVCPGSLCHLAMCFWTGRRIGVGVHSCTDGMPGLGCSPEIGGWEGGSGGVWWLVGGCGHRSWMPLAVWSGWAERQNRDKWKQCTINQSLQSWSWKSKYKTLDDAWERHFKCKNTIFQVVLMIIGDFLPVIMGLGKENSGWIEWWEDDRIKCCRGEKHRV